MKHLMFGLAGVALATSLVVAQARPPMADHFLDIVGFQMTAADPQATGSGIEGGVVGGTSGTPRVDWLRLRLLSVNPTSLELQQSFEYEVLIENAGDKGVLLPWSPDRVLFRGHTPRTMKGLKQASLALVARSPEGKEITYIAPLLLYGSDERANSLLLLAPGKSARIRVPGVWRDSERALREVQAAGSPTPLAAMFISLSQDETISLRSANSVEAVLGLPKSWR